LESGRATVMFDCGTGALSALRQICDYSALDAVVVTHMHADHFFDLVPLRYGLTYGPSLRATPLPLWLPPGGEAVLRTVCSGFGRDRAADFFSAFELRTYDARTHVEIGDVTLSFAAVRHYIDAYAVRAHTESAAFVYSGDSAPCDALVDLARACDLFLCEASLGTSGESEPRGHSSAQEAGAMAAAANVRALALTHYPAECSIDALGDAAASRYGGPITVADDGMRLTVTRA
jgi:ribonuclease BN (tRNA processing enzyme)